MFDNQNHIHAIATAIGTLGGFQEQPDWFKAVAKTSIWQVLMCAVLVYQGGGNLDFTYSLVIAILFYSIVKLTGYLKFNINTSDLGIGSGEDNSPPAEATEQEAESFLGYY